MYHQSDSLTQSEQGLAQHRGKRGWCLKSQQGKALSAQNLRIRLLSLLYRRFAEQIKIDRRSENLELSGP